MKSESHIPSSVTMTRFLKYVVGHPDFQQSSWDADVTTRVFYVLVNNFLKNIMDNPYLKEAFEAILATNCREVLLSDIRYKSSFPKVKWQIASFPDRYASTQLSSDIWLEDVLWNYLTTSYGERVLLLTFHKLYQNGDLRADCGEDCCYQWSISECESCIRSLCTER